MKISRMEVSLHRLPLRTLGDSTLQITHIELILCKLSTNTSHNRVGYSYIVGDGAAAVATLCAPTCRSRGSTKRMMD